MFGWFKERKAKNEKHARQVLEMLTRATMSVHPDRFIVPEDAAMAIGPTLVTMNRILGKADDLRFTPLRFDVLVNQVSFYEGEGVIGKLGAAVAHDDVALALVMAAMHIKHNAIRRHEVRSMAETLVEYVNRVAVHD